MTSRVNFLAVLVNCFSSAAASAISNVGPGLGEIIGPSGNYSLLDNGAKWILAITMIMGIAIQEPIK